MATDRESLTAPLPCSACGGYPGEEGCPWKKADCPVFGAMSAGAHTTPQDEQIRTENGTDLLCSVRPYLRHRQGCNLIASVAPRRPFVCTCGHDDLVSLLRETTHQLHDYARWVAQATESLREKSDTIRRLENSIEGSEWAAHPWCQDDFEKPGREFALGYHVIPGESLLTMLRRVASGESPDLVYAEEWANADHDVVEGGDDA